ncbi:universal stress protein [Mycolicibacterium aubagnense]|uniref:Universal stress protein n=1 Tax=Mycolicibacterium aubagnense TaxID=319707 RepID=A0ABM7I8U3_9MYCO|nr:universal stress protein [Mycolicibacterium aubagnense]WGI35069.1 universal stress protein [Mycolicibacterium aubagnense]BBX82997.1 universal stress protein [Mycolicibacterium aubagnense]
MHTEPAAPVIVGIDGSPASESAALWAAQEAARRNVELRLIYVVNSVLGQSIPAESYRVDVEKAKTVLAAVRRQVVSTIPEARVKTDFYEGNPAGVLVAESRFASLICLGTNGIGRFVKAFLGSTAETVAGDAACSVALIRTADATKTADFHPQFIVAPVSVYADDSRIIRAAVRRARHHHSPVLALGVKDNDLGATPRDVLDQMVDRWRQEYPDVTWYPVATNAGLPHFLRDHPELAVTVVLNSTGKLDISSVIGGIHREPVVMNQLVVFIDRDHDETESRTDRTAASTGDQTVPQ